MIMTTSEVEGGNTPNGSAASKNTPTGQVNQFSNQSLRKVAVVLSYYTYFRKKAKVGLYHCNQEKIYLDLIFTCFLTYTSSKIVDIKYLSRLFLHAAHDTTYASSGNNIFITHKNILSNKILSFNTSCMQVYSKYQILCELVKFDFSISQIASYQKYPRPRAPPSKS